MICIELLQDDRPRIFKAYLQIERFTHYAKWLWRVPALRLLKKDKEKQLNNFQSSY